MPGAAEISPQEYEALSVDGELLSPEEEAQLESADGPVVGLPDTIDQEALLRELWKDLHRGEHAAAILAEAEMRRVIELNQSLDHRFVDGMGQLVARVPLSVYLHWTARYGHEFWQQADSLDFIANRADGGRGNPGFTIKTKGRPTIIKDELFPPALNTSAPTVAHGGKPAGAVKTTAPAVRPRGRRGRWAA